MRQQLEKKLGFRLPDQAWKFLIDRLYVAEVEQRESTIPALSKEVREFYRAFGDGFPERRPTSEMLPSREKARHTRGESSRASRPFRSCLLTKPRRMSRCEPSAAASSMTPFCRHTRSRSGSGSRPKRTDPPPRG